MLEYKYYMRLDSDTFIVSRLWTDPFVHMAGNDFKYGFIATVCVNIHTYMHTYIHTEYRKGRVYTEFARLYVYACERMHTYIHT